MDWVGMLKEHKHSTLDHLTEGTELMHIQQWESQWLAANNKNSGVIRGFLINLDGGQCMTLQLAVCHIALHFADLK